MEDEDILDKITQLLQEQQESFTETQQAVGDNLYLQLEALLSVTSILPLRYPLPPMRGWAISPDFGVLLVSWILKTRPRLVLELGSGVSTLLIAYCLQKIGHGRVVSLDHDEKYCAQSRCNIKDHGLDGFSEILYAPLRKIQLNEERWDWYDTTGINNDRKIDLLVIDGPPGQIQDISRYPALPLLHTRFSDGMVVLLDDAARPDEKIIVERWCREFPGLTHEFIPAEKGAAVLRHSD